MIPIFIKTLKRTLGFIIASQLLPVLFIPMSFSSTASFTIQECYLIGIVLDCIVILFYVVYVVLCWCFDL